jgi:hypothetical protein
MILAMKKVNVDNHKTRIPDESGGSEHQSLEVPAGALLETWSSDPWSDGVQINEMDNLESLKVTTSNSTYEITIIGSRTGDVLVRGGRFFPDFTRVRLAGSSLGGSFLKMFGIYVGFRMEIHHDGQPIITSPVRSIELVNGSTLPS